MRTSVGRRGCGETRRTGLSVAAVDGAWAHTGRPEVAVLGVLVERRRPGEWVGIPVPDVEVVVPETRSGPSTPTGRPPERRTVYGIAKAGPVGEGRGRVAVGAKGRREPGRGSGSLVAVAVETDGPTLRVVGAVSTRGRDEHAVGPESWRRHLTGLWVGRLLSRRD